MKISGVAAKAAMALAAFAVTVPAQAAAPSKAAARPRVAVPAVPLQLAEAEQLRRLDIMLMVTGLRCRTTADNFNAEYGRFTTSHMATLNAAGAQLKAQMAAKHGAAGANRALDKFSTTMANTYGQGHPWLSCAELKAATASLSQVKGRATLLEAADQLLAGGRGAEFAIARRR